MTDPLSIIGRRYITDKVDHHKYTPHYHHHFQHLRGQDMVLLELGVGGESQTTVGGGSLRMWGDYFERGKIYGVDIYDKSFLDEPRIKTFVASQADKQEMTAIIEKIGAPDIIIDDASHINSLTILSFEILFQHLKAGGIYVIEDIESSWWPEHGFGGTRDLLDHNFPSSINFAKGLLLDLNYRYAPVGGVRMYPIASMHFYPNMIVFVKE